MLYTVQNEKEEWDVDQRLIDRLKDQYKKERKGMKSSKSFSHCLAAHSLFYEAYTVAQAPAVRILINP